MAKKLVYRTITGIEIEYIPVSPIVLELAEQGIKREFKERGEPIDPPTYTSELAGGGTQTFPHDETTLTTEAEKEAWRLYKDALQRLEDEQGITRTRIVLECIQGISLPDDDLWERKQKANHVKVPQDPDEKYMHYLKTEILRSAADFSSLTDVILQAGYLGSVSEDVIEASSNLFQNRIQEAARKALDSSPKLEIPDDLGESGRVGT